MTVITLDKIVKNILLKRRYPLQYYIEFLVNAKDCLRELSFDLPMQTIRYKVLSLNDNHAIEMPNDYQDWASVSVRIGQHLHRLVPDSGLNLVPNYDANFEIQPYSSGIATDPTIQFSGYYSPYWWMTTWNAWGESIGRQFGGVGSYSDTFKENRARNEIKINENLDCSEVVLEYIGNGMDSDSATHINPYCQATMEAYCMWMFKENNRTYSAGEAESAKKEYEKQYGILLGRFSDLTVDVLRRIVQKNSIAIKM